MNAFANWTSAVDQAAAKHAHTAETNRVELATLRGTIADLETELAQHRTGMSESIRAASEQIEARLLAQHLARTQLETDRHSLYERATEIDRTEIASVRREIALLHERNELEKKSRRCEHKSQKQRLISPTSAPSKNASTSGSKRASTSACPR